MYSRDVPLINGAMRADFRTFKRGVMFAILSARVQFPRVPDQCAELAKEGAKAKCLWGHKFGAYQYIEEHGATLWHDVCNERDPEQALYILTRIPGLGIVKAAFILQMLGHDIACLDVRNIIRDGRDPRAFRSDAKETRGKAEFYWDRWCEEVAKDYGSTAERISQDHVNAIVRKSLRDCPMPVTKATDIPF
jgi:hypothetical protein